ncbi:MAG TPA: nuclear transport factor 2 family protein [Rubrobacter sp.]|nr:nuclear transport factor 2 family protein [Rubrobacter sp.]
MDERRVPNLEEMDEQQALHFLTEQLANLSAEEEYELRHEDYAMEMPQSGERIRGRGKMREFQEAYPTPPTIRLRRVVVREGLWVAEGVNDYGDGQVFAVVAIFELRDGKIWRDTRYYAEPFEAPEWRAQWVEQMKP